MLALWHGICFGIIQDSTSPALIWAARFEPNTGEALPPSTRPLRCPLASCRNPWAGSCLRRAPSDQLTLGLCQPLQRGLGPREAWHVLAQPEAGSASTRRPPHPPGTAAAPAGTFGHPRTAGTSASTSPPGRRGRQALRDPQPQRQPQPDGAASVTREASVRLFFLQVPRPPRGVLAKPLTWLGGRLPLGGGSPPRSLPF